MANYIKRWRALWNPDMYHGWGKEKNYFEGWYYKVVDAKEQYALAVIPGISRGKNGESHAFIQVLDGKKCTATYHRFPVESFRPSGEQFALNLGSNFFSADQIQLDLPNLKGEVSFSNLTPWPKMLGAPGIMGWYSFVPFMECYHGVVSVHHNLEGTLRLDEKTITLDGGLGYMEKDWGRSFPNAWIWTQTNHFENSGPISLMASVANIPWLGSHFVGYIVGFLFEDKLYRFATYTGASMQASLEEDKVRLAFRDRANRLEIIAHKAGGGDLVSPISGEMTGKVNESMQAKLDIQFFEKEKLLFKGTGRNAGLEVAGEVDSLLTDNWRR